MRNVISMVLQNYKQLPFYVDPLRKPELSYGVGNVKKDRAPIIVLVGGHFKHDQDREKCMCLGKIASYIDERNSKASGRSEIALPLPPAENCLTHR